MSIELVECPLCRYSSVELTSQEQRRVECRSCGRYTFTASSYSKLRALSTEDARRLAWRAREASERGEFLSFHSENVDQYLASAPKWNGALESLDRIVLFVAEKTPSAEALLTVSGYEFPAFRSHNPDELLFLFKTLEEMGLVKRSGNWELRLTPQGWSRAIDLRKTAAITKRAFVAMWFHADTEEAWTKGLEPGIREAGYDPFRIDRKEHDNKIDDEIVAAIRQSGLVVADFTGQRAGVYYEAGFADGLGIHVIRTCRSDQAADIHFDTRQYNHILWETAYELRSRLVARIQAWSPPATGK
jgi:nucleoside 2-deoxyribosyltransferase